MNNVSINKIKITQHQQTAKKTQIIAKDIPRHKLAIKLVRLSSCVLMRSSLALAHYRKVSRVKVRY